MKTGYSTNNSQAVALVLIAIATAITLVIEHYTWLAIAFFTTTTIHLNPPWTYVAGTATIGIYFSIWCGLQHAWWPIVGFWIIVLAAGAADIATYILDWAITGRTANATAGIAALVLGAILVLIVVSIASIRQYRVLQRQNRALRAEKAVIEGMAK